MERFYFLAIGLVLGASLIAYVIYKMAPRLMIRESRSRYDFEQTLKQLQLSIDQKGWKTPHVHDLQATMMNFNFEVRKVKVMEVCKPDYAYMVLSRDDERIASTMMPCRISVYEKSDGQVYVSRMNSVRMGGVFGGVIKKAMDKAGRESEEIISSVAL